jgi:hypothetical protein
LSFPGDASGNWVSITSSSDGTKLAAASQEGGIWTSSNSGTNWVQTSAPLGYWDSITSSSDGTKLAAVALWVGISNSEYPGGIWTSSNSGTNWVQTSALPSGFSGFDSTPLSIASSSDGTKLALAIADFGILTSTTSGTNLVKSTAPTNVFWYSIASSADGAKLAAVSAYEGGGPSGGIWISSNFGTNWAEATDLPLADWYSIASSSNGTILAAAAADVYIGANWYPGGIWITSNEGATWAQTSAAGADWTSIASSSDGTKLAAVAAGNGGIPGGIWTSSNSGTNWGQISAPGVDWVSTLSSASWWCIASSSNGTKLAAGIYGGGIWSVLNGLVSHQSAAVSGSTIVGTTGFLEGNFGTVIELIYAGGGQFIALYQTGSFFGH